MYEKAYQICGDDTMLRAYLYACSKYMQEDDYQELVLKSEKYMKLAEEVEAMEKKTESLRDKENDKQLLESLKSRYRRYI